MKYVAGAVVASNEAKAQLLGVDPADPKLRAVSEPVAQAQWQPGAARKHTATAITELRVRVGERRKSLWETVCFTVLLDDGRTTTRTVRLEPVEERSTMAMHLRRTLSGIPGSPSDGEIDNSATKFDRRHRL